jgi:hypothetical protein
MEISSIINVVFLPIDSTRAPVAKADTLPNTTAVAIAKRKVLIEISIKK